MDKRYNPSKFEGRLQKWWYERGFFLGEAPSERPSYCIMIPPPNVTGSLHMGHALQSTIQDLLTRWKRMLGYNALWLPGTDHAGIATQLMVERHLESEGTDRLRLGREKFVEGMWDWTRQHSGNIRRQLDLLGASCDWSRERFTLDEGLSRAVREAFVRLYRDGKIYRGEYMVNWSPGLDTAISDLEVEMRPVRGKLYHIAYPVAGSEERIVVATTRPETMLGDTGVAYHPEDERAAALRGREAVLPLVGRRLPFIADEVVDPSFGTGLVKVTPAHDPTDFEMGRRHGLETVQVIDRRGHMTEAAGGDYAGLDRFEARRLVVERLQAEGYLEKVEEYDHNVGHCSRSGVPIEPLISTQWFCDSTEMAQAALREAREGRLELVPESWLKTWEHWLENIKPWCISRQLWWGHRIPAWYTADGECFVAESREAAEKEAGTDALTRDPDVLDTWFSSALWPFSTLGWPDTTEDLKTFYPTDVLVTAFDILFFWVARMVMTGLHFTGEGPFRAVHLTGLVRDAHGRKMSKTLGNTVDPLDLVAEYGADAVRFTLASLDSPGRDIPLDPERMAGYRAFGNKIWNATRFVLTRIGESRVQEAIDPAGLAAPERWILSRLSRTADEVDRKFETFRFDEGCRALYQFFWGELCDWYIELSKPVLLGRLERPRVGEVLVTVLERSLRLLHPVMPFLTEELWQRLPGREAVHPETICRAAFPRREEGWEDAEAEAAMGRFVALVSRIRNLRAETGVPAGARIELRLDAGDEEGRDFLAQHEPLIRELTRAGAAGGGPTPAGMVRDVVGGIELTVAAPGCDAGEADRERREREIRSLGEQIARAEAALANPQFVAKAPAAVVQKRRERLAELQERIAGLQNGTGSSART